MMASIVIRTLNEGKYLEDLLRMIARQKQDDFAVEVVVVDSGSSDRTLEIANKHGATVTHIDKNEFSFGRSLNRGCEAARGDILVFISGHCVPVDERWLMQLCAPLLSGQASYCYGGQIGDDDSNFSERRVFAKYFPSTAAVPQDGFYCNNANSAILRDVWARHRFDEGLTGLEDMALAKAVTAEGGKIGYVSDAKVFHHHQETWAQVRRRFEREAIALRSIMPEVHLSRWDTLRYITSSVLADWIGAARHRQLMANAVPILRYRIEQFTGAYRGNNEHRKLSQKAKERFYYPSTQESDVASGWLKSHRRTPSNESQQSAR